LDGDDLDDELPNWGSAAVDEIKKNKNLVLGTTRETLSNYIESSKAGCPQGPPSKNFTAPDDETSRRLKRVGNYIELAPNHTFHVRKYKAVQCIENGGIHPLCRSYNPSTGMLSRNTVVVKRWLVQQGFSTGTAPADTSVGHILPLYLGGPDCGCNF
jgi:hypothetical protein